MDSAGLTAHGYKQILVDKRSRAKYQAVYRKQISKEKRYRAKVQPALSPYVRRKLVHIKKPVKVKNKRRLRTSAG